MYVCRHVVHAVMLVATAACGGPTKQRCMFKELVCRPVSHRWWSPLSTGETRTETKYVLRSTTSTCLALAIAPAAAVGLCTTLHCR
jgi:hypothetical protein